MRFENAWWLLLLLAIPFLHRLWKRRSEPARFRFSVPIPKSISMRSPLTLLLVIRYAALALLLIALARPQTSVKQMEKNVRGIDIMLVMDVSASMNIEDLSERPRFDIAKDTMRDFVKGRSNDRIGFVVFSGEPLTLAPPTLDYSLLFQVIQNVKVGVLKDGTAIGDGLSLAVSRLKESNASSRVIILLTDGDNNVGQIDPATAGDLAAGFGIRVYAIAIGREGRVKLPIRRQGAFGNTSTSYQWFDNALNPQLLQQIAELTDGKFYRVTDEEALSSVFREIDQLEKSDVKGKEKVRYDDHYSLPLLLGAFLILIERILALGWWRILT